MVSKPKIIKYSKDSQNYRRLKEIFWHENENLLVSEDAASKFYSSGVARRTCKICNGQLPATADLYQHGSEFKICRTCNHLNGTFEEDARLTNYLYNNLGSEGEDYSKNYTGDFYIERASSFYGPKVDFLREFVGIENPSLIDIGCGAGHFVHEALRAGFNATGIDLGYTSVNYGNDEISKSLGVKPLRHVQDDQFLNEVAQFEGDIITAIGVIEHLQNPRSLAEAFKSSRANYMFFSIPLFSLSVFLENVFLKTAPRLLTIAGGHTHLFSEKSYELLVKTLGAEVVAEWRFGSDILDFSRSLEIELKHNQSSDFAIDYFKSGIADNIDSLQEILDRNGNFSEIHVLARKS